MNTPTTPPTPDTPDTPDVPQTRDVPQAADATAADTTAAGTLADEVFVDADRTTPIPTWAPPAPTATTGATATGATATATAPAPAATRAPAPTAAPEPEWIKGPAPFALVLGLLGLVVAASVLVGELTDVTLPWNDLGPWSVVAAGIVVLIVGAIGLRSSRSRG